jgi:hypothetical protein
MVGRMLQSTTMAQPAAQSQGSTARNPRLHVTSTGVQISMRQLWTVMAGVMLGLLLASLDQTVVGPAVYKIIGDLRGLEHYSWVTTCSSPPSSARPHASRPPPKTSALARASAPAPPSPTTSPPP